MTQYSFLCTEYNKVGSLFSSFCSFLFFLFFFLFETKFFETRANSVCVCLLPRLNNASGLYFAFCIYIYRTKRR
ncbi:hypothetical protein BCR43DRAFT_294258 [Syncephalastrum racemosum]|uniref:Uncharacterized protein n=1 Tax=Syncephalastrum racemosum TaxID=13706 RepID=A0A1X2HDV7_SYNRA|nr:hypothetical protein BCR43DRAFT_294258 [Syncephalastrum racemosum]